MRFVVALILVLASTATMAEPLRQTFKDAMVERFGRSISDDRNTTFYDAMGRNTGRSATSGGTTTTVYDQMGRQTGRSR